MLSLKRKNKATIKIHSKWTKLQPLPSDVSIGSVISINDHEFIVTSNQYGSFKYNMNQNELSFHFNYETSNLSLFHHQSAINQTKQELYLYSGNIKIIDLKTSKYYAEERSYGHPKAGFLFIDNHFHIIKNYNKHIIINYKPNNKKMEIIFDTSDNNNAKNFIYPSVIYIPSKQSILLFGGYYYDSPLACALLSNEIRIYSLITQKWNIINNITFKGNYFGAVLTSDEKYIILFGGRIYDNNVDDIFVLNIKDDNEFKLNKSKIHCPHIGKCHAVRTGGIDSKNDILVIGFIKQCFKEKELKNMQLPPFYIMKLIENWHSTEMMHWIKGNSHYCITLKHILS